MFSNASMKVLFINPSPVFGGASTATISIARMLQAEGVEVVYSDEYDSLNIRQGLTVDHYPYHARKFKSHHETIRHIIEDVKPSHVIWTPLVMPYYYIDILKMKKAGVRQISVIHSISLSQNTKGKLMDYMVSKCLRILDAIVFVSNYTLRSWSKCAAVKEASVIKKVIYNAVNYTGVLGEITRPYRIGFVGRFSDEKQPAIYCSLSEIQHLNGFEFHAFGDGPLFKYCKNIYTSVIYHGNIDDVEEIYKNIDLLVLTSKFENCPMVILEAMARGIPCVAPSVGGIPEIVNDGLNGRLYFDYENETIASAIEEVFHNYNHFSRGCSECSKSFTFDNVGRVWMEFLSDLV